MRSSAVIAQARVEVLPAGLCRIPMGDRCQSRYKFVPEVPEAVRTAQVWHLRYQGDFMQPSVVTVLRERASDFAHKPERKTRSPDRRVQVAPDSSPRAPDGMGGQNRSPSNASQHANHPDIRPGEALVCKTSNGQVTYWAQSKLVSGCEQWRQLAALPPKPPPGGRGGGGGGRRPRQGILSPVPRKGVQFEDKRTRAELPTSETFDAALDVAANEVPPPCLHETYLPQIQHSFQQRRMQRISADNLQRMICRRFAKSRLSKRAVVSSLARLEGNA